MINNRGCNESARVSEYAMHAREVRAGSREICAKNPRMARGFHINHTDLANEPTATKQDNASDKGLICADLLDINGVRSDLLSFLVPF